MWSDMMVFWNETDDACQAVLDVLEAGKLVGWEVEVQGVAVIQFGVYQ